MSPSGQVGTGRAVGRSGCAWPAALVWAGAAWSPAGQWEIRRGKFQIPEGFKRLTRKLNLLFFWPPHTGMQDLSSPTRDQTHSPTPPAVEARESLDHRGKSRELDVESLFRRGGPGGSEQGSALLLKKRDSWGSGVGGGLGLGGKRQMKKPPSPGPQVTPHIPALPRSPRSRPVPQDKSRRCPQPAPGPCDKLLAPSSHSPLHPRPPTGCWPALAGCHLFLDPPSSPSAGAFP